MENTKKKSTWAKLAVVFTTLVAILCLFTIHASAANESYDKYIYQKADGSFASTKDANKALKSSDTVIAYSSKTDSGKILAASPENYDPANGKDMSLHKADNGKLYVQLCEGNDDCQNGAVPMVDQDGNDVTKRTTTFNLDLPAAEANTDVSVKGFLAPLLNPFTNLSTLPKNDNSLSIRANVLPGLALVGLPALGIPLALTTGALAVGIPATLGTGALLLGTPLVLGAGALAVGIPTVTLGIPAAALTAATLAAIPPALAAKTLFDVVKWGTIGILGAKTLASLTAYKVVSIALIPAKLLLMRAILTAHGVRVGALVGGMIYGGPLFRLMLPLGFGVSALLTIPEAVALSGLTFKIVL